MALNSLSQSRLDPISNINQNSSRVLPTSSVGQSNSVVSKKKDTSSSQGVWVSFANGAGGYWTYPNGKPLSDSEQLTADFEDSESKYEKAVAGRESEIRTGYDSLASSIKSGYASVADTVRSLTNEKLQTARDILTGSNEQSRLDTIAQYESERESGSANLMAQGYSGTTAVGTLGLEVADRKTAALNRLDESLADKRLNLETTTADQNIQTMTSLGLGAIKDVANVDLSRLNFIENINDIAPDRNLLLQQQEALGAKQAANARSRNASRQPVTISTKKKPIIVESGNSSSSNRTYPTQSAGGYMRPTTYTSGFRR